MKNLIFILLISLCSMITNGQKTQKNKPIDFSTSLGYGFGKKNNFGFFFNNEVSIYLTKRIGITTNLTAFQSLLASDPVYNSYNIDGICHYGFFLDILFSIMQNFDRLSLELQTGPSGLIGRETGFKMKQRTDGEIDLFYVQQDIENIGLSANFKFTLKTNKKIDHFLILKTRYKIIHLEYLGLCYGVKFRI